MEYKVVSAIKGREYTDKFGQKVAYIVQLEGQDEAVEINQKLTTPAPKAGDVLNGTIESTQYGKKFKKAFNQNAPQAQGHQGGSKQFKADPDSRESIEWQTSLKAAVDVVRDFYGLKGLPEEFKLEDYAREVDSTAVHFKNLINLKPESVKGTVVEDEEVAEDEAPDKLQDPDLPPVELYE